MFIGTLLSRARKELCLSSQLQSLKMKRGFRNNDLWLLRGPGFVCPKTYLVGWWPSIFAQVHSGSGRFAWSRARTTTWSQTPPTATPTFRRATNRRWTSRRGRRGARGWGSGRPRIFRACRSRGLGSTRSGTRSWFVILKQENVLY